jgi:CheY-like chemotaxis protein
VLTVKSTVSSPSPSPSVWIVDDDKFIHEVLKEMLSLLGVSHIHVANNGFEALRLLAAQPNPPDFLICDVFMPDMDGIEFLAKLRKHGYPGGLILISGVDKHMLGLSALLAAADGFKLLGSFVKPVTLKQLADVMNLRVMD